MDVRVRPPILQKSLSALILAPLFASLDEASLLDPNEDLQDAAGLLKICKDLGSSSLGPFDKLELVKQVTNITASIMESASMLMPGAGVVIDLCKWFGERYQVMKKKKRRRHRAKAKG